MGGPTHAGGTRGRNGVPGPGGREGGRARGGEGERVGREVWDVVIVPYGCPDDFIQEMWLESWFGGFQGHFGPIFFTHLKPLAPSAPLKYHMFSPIPLWGSGPGLGSKVGRGGDAGGGDAGGRGDKTPKSQKESSMGSLFFPDSRFSFFSI